MHDSFYNFVFTYYGFSMRNTILQEYAEKSYTYYDWLSRDFFKFIVDNSYRRYWDTPGDIWRVENKYQQSVKEDAQFAYYKALEALDDYSKGYSYCWHNEWREIYGARFPES